MAAAIDAAAGLAPVGGVNDANATGLEIKRRFRDFVRPEDQSSKYMTKVRAMMEAFALRVIINISDLREFDKPLTRAVLLTPQDFLPLLEATLKDIVLELDATYFDAVAERNMAYMTNTTRKAARIMVGFEGNFGDAALTPRSLGAEHLFHLVAVEGIVTRVSLVHPKVVRSVHFCAQTKAFTARDYRDAYDAVGGALPTGTVWPTRDEAGNALETEFGLCVFKDTQTVTIQEMPESAPLGQLPRSVDVYVEHDLVDSVKPGDRVCAVGVYRALTGASAHANVLTGAFHTSLQCCALSRTSRETGSVKLTGEDVKNITRTAKRSDVFDLLARSLAPSIYGHKHVKRAIALMLAGGREHNLENGTHIRGDINILMVGDPSTAKSQLLRFILNIAPLAVNTTGRGSTGVGLTAAVTSDPETGERRLEAGAMVLADRGVVCIDEFDKMSDADRVAIHEVMEQQTVTIAKAGITASLNARCSVVAAANPIYGRFDSRLPLSRNVALPDSLISRFDLVFIIRDAIHEALDARVAAHVCRMHRYVQPGCEGVPVAVQSGLRDADEDNDQEDDDGTSVVFAPFHPLLHGGAAADAPASASRTVELLTLPFIRKYVSYARHRPAPTLTDAARGAIVENYNEFRQRARDRATVITARSLETLIRLSTAHAKLRLSTLVEAKDVQVAYDILNFALYADARARNDAAAPTAAVVPAEQPAAAPEGDRGAPPPARTGKRSRAVITDSDDEDADEAVADARKRRSEQVQTHDDAAATHDEAATIATVPVVEELAVPVDIDSPEHAAVKLVLGLYRRRTHNDTVSLAQLVAWAGSASDARDVAMTDALATTRRLSVAQWRAHLNAESGVMMIEDIMHYVR